MEITQHGRWIARNDIDSALMGHPPNVLIIVREGDAQDWYEYQRHFKPDTIKAAVVDGHVINAVVDVSMICPAEHLLIEIDDTTGDPKEYIGRAFDVEQNAFVG
jgi:hypothetical protein